MSPARHFGLHVVHAQPRRLKPLWQRRIESAGLFLTWIEDTPNKVLGVIGITLYLCIVVLAFLLWSGDLALPWWQAALIFAALFAIYWIVWTLDTFMTLAEERRQGRIREGEPP